MIKGSKTQNGPHEPFLIFAKLFRTSLIIVFILLIYAKMEILTYNNEHSNILQNVRMM